MTTAIILAAGAGSKMFPYNDTRQKCTIPIVNVPIVKRLIKGLAKAGVTKVVVVIGHLGEQVRHALHDVEDVRITYVKQHELNGTAAAVLCAVDEIGEDELGENFIIAYGDVVTTESALRAFAHAHLKASPLASVLVQPLNDRDSRDWICASVDGEQLREVIGHPRSSSHRLCGIFAMHRNALKYIHANPGIMSNVPVGGMPPIESELAQSIQMMLEDGCEVHAVTCADFLIDVDKPWHILEATHHVLDEMAQQLDKSIIAPSAKISDSAEINAPIALDDGCVIGNRVVINGPMWAAANTQITNGAILRGHNAFGRSCRIRDYCLVGSHTVLGNRCIVGHGAEFDGVAFDVAYFYHYCEIAGVIGNAVDIGAATVCGTLRFDDAETVHIIRGRREIPRIGANATYIGDYCRTGVNAIIMPGCKIGAYSIVGPGVVLYEDLPPRTMVLVKQELVKKQWGPEKYGW